MPSKEVEDLKRDNAKLHIDKDNLVKDKFKLVKDKFELVKDKFELEKDKLKLENDKKNLQEEVDRLKNSTLKTDSVLAVRGDLETAEDQIDTDLNYKSKADMMKVLKKANASDFLYDVDEGEWNKEWKKLSLPDYTNVHQAKWLY
ncbi:hypothetical protein U1Q18_050791 [Sarracenia purpurea var. burkii]